MREILACQQGSYLVVGSPVVEKDSVPIFDILNRFLRNQLFFFDQLVFSFTISHLEVSPFTHHSPAMDSTEVTSIFQGDQISADVATDTPSCF